MGTKVPEGESSRERKLKGANWPGSRVLFDFSLQGVNWPMSEKAAIP